MDDEYGQWVSGLPFDRFFGRKWFPDPGLPGGLPPNWAVESRLPLMGGRIWLFLARRRDGGWSLLVHQPKIVTTTCLEQAQTLGALYVHAQSGAETWNLPCPTEPVLRWLADLLLPLFDLSDPGEAAEATMAALGGQVQRLPHAATRW